MGVLFEAGDVVVWSPSPRLARLFLAQVRALEELVGKQSGIGEIVADEVRVDPAALNAFVAAVADALSSTTNATMRSLMAGPFSMAAGLSSACGHTTSAMSGIAGELARRGAELVTGRGDLRSYDSMSLSDAMTPRARALAHRMSLISQAAYHAEWMDGLEFALWRIANSGGGRYGQSVVDEQTARELLQLAADAGGWITFDDDEEETLVDWSRWLHMYGNSPWFRPDAKG